MSTLGRLVALPIACLAGGLVACAPPPPPDPPRIAAIELTPTLADHVLVLGTLHAAEPGLDVFGVSLERASPPARGFVAADGSFLLEVPGVEGDVLRIQTEEAGLGSAPVDVIAAFGPAVEAAPELPCLRVPGAIHLEGASGTVELTNECEQAIAIESIALRATAPLELGAAAQAIAPGGSLVLELTRTGEALDAVVIVHVSAPARDRRAISVRSP